MKHIELNDSKTLGKLFFFFTRLVHLFLQQAELVSQMNWIIPQDLIKMLGKSLEFLVSENG